MIIQRYLARASVAGMTALSLSGVALASTVDMDTTGANSNNQVTITNIQTDNTVNDNTITVTNVNIQSAKTGDVTASNNTSVAGPLASGAASNNATQSTSVAINNGGAGMGNGPVAPGGGAGNGGGSIPVGGSGSDSHNTVSTVGGRGSGSVLGVATGGMGAGSAATLPSVGASVPMDVSGLRALYQPQTAAPTTELAKHGSLASTLFLVAASILSLLGGAVSAVTAHRRHLKG